MDLDLLALFRQVLSDEIQEYTLQPLRGGAESFRVARVHLRCTHHGLNPHSVILKFSRSKADGSDDPTNRESLFYASCAPRLSFRLPSTYFNGAEPGTGRSLLILEDLKPAYWFPRTSHRWAREELKLALRAYARLHVEGQDLLSATADRSWLYSYLNPPLDPAGVLRDYRNLIDEGHWMPVPGLEALVDEAQAAIQSLTGRPQTLLHHDVWPSNVALPLKLRGEAGLVDWEMAGVGPAELDLAYLFLEPYQGARELRPADILDAYWQERKKLEGRIPPSDQRQAAQRQAEVLLALSLIRVARTVARVPFPVDSRPGAYWRVMHETLPARLRRLSGGSAQ